MFTCYLAMEMSCSFHFRLDLYRQTVEKFVLSGYIVQNNLLELHCSCMSVLSGKKVQKNVLSNKKRITIETILLVILLKILINIGAKIPII